MAEHLHPQISRKMYIFGANMALVLVKTLTLLHVLLLKSINSHG